jgi:hypothetical protein
MILIDKDVVMTINKNATSFTIMDEHLDGQTYKLNAKVISPIELMQMTSIQVSNTIGHGRINSNLALYDVSISISQS